MIQHINKYLLLRENREGGDREEGRGVGKRAGWNGVLFVRDCPSVLRCSNVGCNNASWQARSRISWPSEMPIIRVYRVCEQV